MTPIDDGTPAPRGWILLAGALVTAAGALVVTFGLLWQYVPGQAALLADAGRPLSLLARSVILLANWTVRLAPLLILTGGPVVVLLAVLAAIGLARPASRGWVFRLLLWGAAGLAVLGAIASVLVVYALRAPS